VGVTAEKLLCAQDPDFYESIFNAQTRGVFQGASSVAAEPDRRHVVRSSVRYLLEKNTAMTPSSASGSSQTSLEAIREVIGEEAPNNFLPVGREESVALHNRVQTDTKKKDAEEWVCDGSGCKIVMRDKSEWHKEKIKKLKKTYYYCTQCYDRGNKAPSMSAEPPTEMS
jgi:hypothetical protein